MLYVIMSLYAKDTLLKVQEAIESLLNQIYTPFYLYAICDGPIKSDVASYVANLSTNHVHISTRERNLGLAYSLNELLNTVLKKEDCTYIARMDADDISMPERFVKQIAFMNSHPDIDCLGTWAIEIDDDGKEYFRKKMPITHEECLELFKKRDCMIHPTVMFRRSYFEKAGLYPEDTYFGEDTMMWAKGFKSGCKFANVPEYLFKFRLDSKIISVIGKRSMYIYIIHIFILDMFRKKMYMNMPLDTVIFFVGIYIVTFISYFVLNDIFGRLIKNGQK